MLRFLGGVIFNGCNGSHFFSFMFLAQKWPHFVKKFTQLEEKMKKYRYCKNITLKMKLVSGVFLLLELGIKPIFIYLFILNLVKKNRLKIELIYLSCKTLHNNL